MTTLQIEIPDDLARAAEREGLLAPTVLATLLRDALRQQAGKRLRETADQLAALNIPAMSMDEVQAEIAAVRAQQRS